jgi:hypothetical protein
MVYFRFYKVLKIKVFTLTILWLILYFQAPLKFVTKDLISLGDLEVSFSPTLEKNLLMATSGTD